jgi:hypothetical protein
MIIMLILEKKNKSQLLRQKSSIPQDKAINLNETKKEKKHKSA